MNTLYVSRPLINTRELTEWAKQQGFKTVLVSSEMHVTICYSKKPVDWDTIDVDSNVIVVPASNNGKVERSIELFGEQKNICVLKFSSEQLKARWKYYMDNGASFDWPSFQPHITLTYDASGVDTAKIVPFDGELIFGGEVMQEIDEDYKANTIEAHDETAAKKPITGALHSQVTQHINRIAKPHSSHKVIKLETKSGWHRTKHYITVHNKNVQSARSQMHRALTSMGFTKSKAVTTSNHYLNSKNKHIVNVIFRRSKKKGHTRMQVLHIHG